MWYIETDMYKVLCTLVCIVHLILVLCVCACVAWVMYFLAWCVRVFTQLIMHVSMAVCVCMPEKDMEWLFFIALLLFVHIFIHSTKVLPWTYTWLICTVSLVNVHHESVSTCYFKIMWLQAILSLPALNTSSFMRMGIQTAVIMDVCQYIY